LSLKAIGQWKSYPTMMGESLDILATDIEAFGDDNA